jgi:hypothetical protein
MANSSKIDFSKLEEYSNEGWSILSPDGKEYGPFQANIIAEYVRQRRITSLFKLKHPSRTKGNWVMVTEFPELVALFPPTELVDETSSQLNASPEINQPVDLSSLRRRRQAQTNDEGGIFGNILLGIVDVQFNHYVTPSIVRFTWVVFLISVFVVTFFGVFLVLSTPPTAASVDATPGRQLQPGQDQRNPSLVTQSFAQVFASGYLPTICVISLLVGGFLAILWVRVLLESIIVQFDISNNVKNIASRQTHSV